MIVLACSGCIVNTYSAPHRPSSVRIVSLGSLELIAAAGARFPAVAPGNLLESSLWSPTPRFSRTL